MIKTWQDRIYEDQTLIAEDAKADEIRELRASLEDAERRVINRTVATGHFTNAALQERDAELERITKAFGTELDTLSNRNYTLRKVLDQALEALNTCRIRSVSEWQVCDVTPKVITAAITAIQEVLK